MEIKIVPMTESHLVQVNRVDHICFTVPWSMQSFENELKNDMARYFVALKDENVVGYCGIWEIVGEGDITNVAVLPEFRRQGIGGRLMKRMIEYGRSRGMSRLTLEVRESNTPARRLYESFGFRQAGSRRNYYSDNQETAVIMALELDGESQKDDWNQSGKES